MSYTGLNAEEIHKKCKYEIRQRMANVKKLETKYERMKTLSSNFQRAAKLAEIRIQILQIETELAVFTRVHDWIDDWGL